VRFLLDHDVPDDIEYGLAALGHEVLKLRDVLPRTTLDEAILRTPLSLPPRQGVLKTKGRRFASNDACLFFYSANSSLNEMMAR
jgi:hypothetical protein